MGPGVGGVAPGTSGFATGAGAPQRGQCFHPRSMPWPHCVQVGRNGVEQFGQNVYVDFAAAPHDEQQNISGSRSTK